MISSYKNLNKETFASLEFPICLNFHSWVGRLGFLTTQLYLLKLVRVVQDKELAFYLLLEWIIQFNFVIPGLHSSMEGGV
jgi:hypothetical protein